MGTTVDALEGGSGGPVLNAFGEVVGVLKNSASVAANSYRYAGNETPGAFDYQSNAVKCEALAEFINEGVESP